MGKIPQYQRDKFVSSYVGAPQLDTEGMKIAESVGNAATNLASIEAKRLGEQAQVRIDQQANNALLKYSLAYQQQAKDLQETYADNPDAYPEAAAAMGMQMQEEFQAKIPDERIRARFGNAANTVVRAGQNVSMAWAEAKNEENAYIAWQDSLDTAVSVTAEQTNIQDFTATLGQIASIAESNTLTTPKARLSARETKIDEATKAFLSGQLEKDARVFWRDADSGKYNDLKYEHKGQTFNVPISAKTLAEYKTLAKSKALSQQAEKQIEAALRVTGDLQELALKVDSGEAGLQELLYKRDQIYAQGTTEDYDENGDRIELATDDVKANIDSLIRLEVSTLAKNGKQDIATLDDLNTKWSKLTDDVAENIDNPENLTTELLKFNTDVNNAFAAGKILQTDYTTMTRRLSVPLMQSIRKQTGQKKGFLGMGGTADPLGGYYKKLLSAVSNMTLNDEQKMNTRTKAFSFFLDEVSAVEDKGQTPTPEQYDEMSTKALRKAQNIYFESVGEPTDKVITINGVPHQYVGLNVNGVPDYQPTGTAQSAAKMKR